jgi:hypothetical protein
MSGSEAAPESDPGFAQADPSEASATAGGRTSLEQLAMGTSPP